MKNHDRRVAANHLHLLALLPMLCTAPVMAQGQLISYATEVSENSGISRTDAELALGPPDYVYVDGTFTEGVTATYVFPAPIDDISGHDLIISAFVSGMGDESASILVEGRAIETDPFVEIGTIVTADGRSPARNNFATFDHVHHFTLDFAGAVRKVREVRLTNMEGDDLKLDAIEGVHPALSGPNQAIEVRIFRLRDDFSKRFALRIKNIGPLETGESLTGFAIEHATDEYIDQTNKLIVAETGSFEATAETTAGPDNGDVRQRTEHMWVGEGDGLPPGDVASHERFDTIDTDVPGDEFLENITFEFTFADGTTISADWPRFETDGRTGQLFALYQYPPSPVSISEARPAFYLDLASTDLDPEPPCTDCASDNDNINDNSPNDNVDNDNSGVPGNTNTNDNEGSSENDNESSEPMVRGTCPAPGMIPFMIMLMSLTAIRIGATRKRTR